MKNENTMTPSNMIMYICWKGALCLVLLDRLWFSILNLVNTLHTKFICTFIWVSLGYIITGHVTEQNNVAAVLATNYRCHVVRNIWNSRTKLYKIITRSNHTFFVFWIKYYLFPRSDCKKLLLPRLRESCAKWQICTCSFLSGAPAQLD